MDIASITTHTNNTPKSPDLETETSPHPTSNRIQLPKPLSVSNGVLKRHNHHHHHHHHLVPPAVISYKECLKNHAASLGGHALDGCGEFMPSPTATPTDPTSLKCAACGCHRNFHRRDPEDSTPHAAAATTTTTIEYQPHHRHHPLPPPPLPHSNRSPSSASPPPISSSYYPSAPHMLLALSGGISDNAVIGGLSSRKRFRTKFSHNQKEKMFQFAERVGWKMQKKDEELAQSFCNEIGVDKGVLKVWMHNNKNTFGKRSDGSNGSVRIASNGNDHSVSAGGDDRNGNGNDNGANNGGNGHNSHENHGRFENDNVGHVGTNGSSSSS